MTTRLRDPWVDPRVLDVRPIDVEAYLRSHGWHFADSPSPQWRRFFSPTGSVREAVLVPLNTEDETLINLLVECVGNIATSEGRYAGELLDELLPEHGDTHTNGTPARPVATRR